MLTLIACLFVLALAIVAVTIAVAATARYRRLVARSLKLATWLDGYDHGFAARVRLLTSRHTLDFDWESGQ